ncbi:MAG TPA: GHMP kinase [Verrucomicrobiota bacterium]|nr:GHMP kinase [Verrucomicrobiota bacterium]
MIIHGKAYARAGLIGNPSDGYYGKTISFVIRNFSAEVLIYETPELEILPNTRDHSRFESIAQLDEDVARHGYYGGIRLLKATVRRFYQYCCEHGIRLDDRNFTLRYQSTIPSLVGLAGSSAIITACLRALMTFYGVTIPKPVQPHVILSVETQELGIPAGLQDRVIQVYEGVVFMDFHRETLEKQGYGRYEELDPALLPPLYVAYRTDLAEGTEVFHTDIRSRFHRGDPVVIDAMKYWADLADQVRTCLIERRWDAIPALLNRNFDKRREIYPISEGNLRMVEAARSVGASAKFAGSGGAIVGTYTDDAMYQRLEARLGAIGVVTLRPAVQTTDDRGPTTDDRRQRGSDE